jgi:hypothetical protein
MSEVGVRKDVWVRVPVVESDNASRVGVGTRVLGTDEMTGSTPVASSASNRYLGSQNPSSNGRTPSEELGDGGSNP